MVSNHAAQVEAAIRLYEWTRIERARSFGSKSCSASQMTRYPISGVLVADNRVFAPDITRQPPQDGSPDRGWTETAAVMASLFDEFILVAADPIELLEWDALIVSDHFLPPGLLSGIQAGLFAAHHPHIFIAAAGNGQVSPAHIDFFVKALEPRWDAVLSESGHGVAPLPGVYGKRALRPLTQQLDCGERRFDLFLSRIRTRRLAASAVDPARTSNSQCPSTNRQIGDLWMGTS